MANFALPHLLSLLLLLDPLFNIVAAQTNGNISVTSFLTAGDNSAWRSSPSEDFAFGFHRVGENSFLPAIWYNKLGPEHTIVWYTNGSSLAPGNSKLELTADRGLVLKDPQGTELWKSGKEAADPVAYAVMNDTGNFVLIGGNSKPIWESFHYPTDTLLPSQIMESRGFLSSRTGSNNFSPGRFQFLFRDGVAKLITKNLPGNFTYGTYYETKIGNASTGSNSDSQVVFNSSGLYVLSKNGSTSFIIHTEDPDSNYYKRVTLNFDGVLTLSSCPKDPSPANETWRTIRSIPENICTAIAAEDQISSEPCGFNSICSIQSDGRPNCKCPRGYSLLDPADEYSGCRPNFLMGCGSSLGQSHQEDYFMWEIQDVNWPFSDYEVLTRSSMESCKNACLHDCLCAAAILGGDGYTCWKKKPPLTNGRDDQSATAYLKIANNPPPKPDPTGNTLVVVVLSVLLGSSVLVIFVGAACMGFFCFFGRRPLAVETSVESRLRQFTYKELTEATNGFKEELGRGSCAIVYKGETRSTGLIAVKKLDRVFEDSDKEFKAEVNIIGQTHHKNLVRLVGYCDENQHRLLVYEFLRNGTLAGFLFGDLKPSWKQRTQIAFGIARGLVYLHEECSTQIIHCDIKPQNILLDEHYNARISDFGLAKLLLINQSYTKTNIRGTKGYVAPEWFRSAPVSVKVDVYSFGVLLLEIICSRRNVDMQVDEEEKRILTDWVYDCYVERKLDVLVENDKEAMDDIKMVERFVMVAVWCLQENPHVRPTMKQVLLMLEGILQISLPPSPRPFSSFY